MNIITVKDWTQTVNTGNVNDFKVNPKDFKVKNSDIDLLLKPHAELDSCINTYSSDEALKSCCFISLHFFFQLLKCHLTPSVSVVVALHPCPLSAFCHHLQPHNQPEGSCCNKYIYKNIISCLQHLELESLLNT